MNYYLFGNSISIISMEKPNGCFGSVFEFTGSNSLKKIGLNPKFYFRCNSGFSNELAISLNQTEIEFSRKNEYQDLLSIFLEKSISNRRITGQFE